MIRSHLWRLAFTAGPLALLIAFSGCTDQGGDPAAGTDTATGTDPAAGADASPGTEASPGSETPETASPPPPADKAAAPSSLGRHYQAAPEFDLPNVDGGSLALSSMKGKVVLLDFWATWCGPCKAAIPHLNSLYAKHRNNGLEIIGISMDQPRGNLSGPELVQKFAEKTRMDYPTVMADADVVQQYGGIRSIPTAFLIDQQGKIRKRYVGLQPKHVFEKAVEDLLGEASSSEDETI